MVEKICKKIGLFIAYCLKLSGFEIANKNNEENMETEITKSLINEWLYGEEAKENGR